jgi:formylglycine-generating enzyme required for sulfatase activity
MVAIPGGRFLMGSPESEAGRFQYEGPQHEVSIQPFYMGKYAVTQAQWLAIAERPKVAIDLDPTPSSFKGDRRPVENVSWDEAVEFCQRLSQATGKPYRLPTEAEWEYACRAGTTSPFHFGATITADLANYDGNYTYGAGPKGKYRVETTDMGSFPPNAFGLYDLHGNVWEWCQDIWHDSYAGAPTDGNAWVNENDNYSRILRGGSCFSNPAYCRSANRSGVAPDDRKHLRSFYVGLRVACGVART